MSEANPTLTDQSGWIVEKTTDGVCAYFSPKAGRDLGNPSGGWSSDPSESLRFAREQDAAEFLRTFIQHEAPFCKPKRFTIEEAQHA